MHKIAKSLNEHRLSTFLPVGLRPGRALPPKATAQADSFQSY